MTEQFQIAGESYLQQVTQFTSERFGEGNFTPILDALYTSILQTPSDPLDPMREIAIAPSEFPDEYDAMVRLVDRIRQQHILRYQWLSDDRGVGLARLSSSKPQATEGTQYVRKFESEDKVDQEYIFTSAGVNIFSKDARERLASALRFVGYVCEELVTRARLHRNGLLVDVMGYPYGIVSLVEQDKMEVKAPIDTRMYGLRQVTPAEFTPKPTYGQTGAPSRREAQGRPHQSENQPKPPLRIPRPKNN